MGEEMWYMKPNIMGIVTIGPRTSDWLICWGRKKHNEKLPAYGVKYVVT
jgi:hypothetical protein